MNILANMQYKNDEKEVFWRNLVIIRKNGLILRVQIEMSVFFYKEFYGTEPFHL